MSNTREAQIASVNARYNEINIRIKKLRGTINVKKSKNEDVSKQETEMKELVNSLKNTVSRLNELRQSVGSTKGDKEPLNFILELMSSSMEGILSTSLGPLEILIQLVDFFIKKFIGFVKDIIDKIKLLLSTIIDQALKLFKDITTLFSAINTIIINNELVQGLWNNLIDLASKASRDVQNIFEKFSKLIMTFVKAIIDNIKNFVDILFTQIKNLFPDITTLYNAISTVENTFKKTQGLFTVMVEVFISVISTFQSIFNKFLEIFLDKITVMDDGVKLFNEQVDKLMGLANLNNQIVNDTKDAFNTSITTLKDNLKTLKSKIDSVSGKTINIPPFGSVSGPSFDISALNIAINNLKTI